MRNVTILLLAILVCSCTFGVAEAQTYPASGVVLRTYDSRFVQVAHENPSQYGNTLNKGSAYWQLEDLGDAGSAGQRRVALRGIGGRYLAAEEDGTVRVNRDQLGAWETWTMIDDGNGYYSFLSHHGRYLSYEAETTLKANRDAVGNWERFALFPFGGDENCSSQTVEFVHEYWTGCTACPGAAFANCNDGYSFVRETACSDNAVLCSNLCKKAWHEPAVQCDEFQPLSQLVRFRPPWVLNTISGPTNPVDGGRTFDGQTSYELGRYVLPAAFTLFIDVMPDGSQQPQQWEHVLELGVVEHGWNAPMRVEVDDASLYIALGDGASFVEGAFERNGGGNTYRISYDRDQSRAEVYQGNSYLGEIFAHVDVPAVNGTMILGSSKGTGRFFHGDIGVVEFLPGVPVSPDSGPRELDVATGLLEFSGSAGHVVGRGDKPYYLPQALTVQAEVRVDASDRWDHLIEFGDAQNEWSEPLRIEVGTEGEWYVSIGDGSSYDEMTFQGSWKFGDWVNLHFTYDAGAGVGRLYENGMHLGDIQSSKSDGSYGQLKLGMHGGQDARYFSGALRNLRIRPGVFAP